MPSSFRGQKDLPNWLEMDYYQRPRALKRWKRWFMLIIVLVCVGGVVAAIFTPQAKKLYQAGPVSPAHAMFNEDCSVCHQQSFQTAKRLVNWSKDISAVPDQACSRCHEGPPHNTLLLEEQRCANCHREHQGRRMLSEVPDSHCLDCHNDLKANRKGDSECLFENVTGFPDGHPEFALWRNKVADPGRLKFNHHAHLKGDGVLMPDGKTKKLDCIKCHQWDQAGRYMKPINYEKHCSECHPLAIQLAGDFNDPKLRELAVQFNKQPAPHEAPEKVRGLLRDRLLSFIQNNPIVGKEADNLRRLPKPRRSLPATDMEWNWAKNQLREMELRLFAEGQLENTQKVLFHNAGGCRFCHNEESRTPAKVGDPGPTPKYELPNLPDRWLTHAKFSHQSHRMLNCKECHDAEPSKKTSDVILPKIDNCKQCHNPSVGAFNSCMECHTYHKHSLAQGVHKNLTINECLRK